VTQFAALCSQIAVASVELLDDLIGQWFVDTAGNNFTAREASFGAALQMRNSRNMVIELLRTNWTRGRWPYKFPKFTALAVPCSLVRFES
jgi:hypothetical protein